VDNSTALVVFAALSSLQTAGRGEPGTIHQNPSWKQTPITAAVDGVLAIFGPQWPIPYGSAVIVAVLVHPLRWSPLWWQGESSQETIDNAAYDESGGLTMSEDFNRDRIARAARIYSSNRDAGLALGIAPGSFGRLCRRYGIETPQARRRRKVGRDG
jgi:hypothetical protein